MDDAYGISKNGKTWSSLLAKSEEGVPSGISWCTSEYYPVGRHFGKNASTAALNFLDARNLTYSVILVENI